jgi:hypothetical protein
MSPAQSGTLPVQATAGRLSAGQLGAGQLGAGQLGTGQATGYDGVMSQGLLLQQAAMALHMAHLGQATSACAPHEPDQALGLHAALTSPQSGVYVFLHPENSTAMPHMKKEDKVPITVWRHVDSHECRALKHCRTA